MATNPLPSHVALVYRLTTDEFAAERRVLPQSVRKQYAATGAYCGVAPLRLPNRRLLWPADTIKQIAAAQMAGSQGESPIRSTRRTSPGDAEHGVRNASTPSSAVATPVDVRRDSMTADTVRRQSRTGEEPRAGETDCESSKTAVDVLSVSAAADSQQVQAPEHGERRPDAGIGGVIAQRISGRGIDIAGRPVVWRARKRNHHFVKRDTSLGMGAD